MLQGQMCVLADPGLPQVKPLIEQVCDAHLAGVRRGRSWCSECPQCPACVASIRRWHSPYSFNVSRCFFNVGSDSHLAIACGVIINNCGPVNLSNKYSALHLAAQPLKLLLLLLV